MPSFINPQEIVKLLPLTNEMTIADFGCGSGYFSLALAKALKPSGRVIALDIWKPALETLEFRAKLEGLFNIIETKWANLEIPKGSGLPNNSCDLVFMSNILFQVKDKKVIIEEAKRVLKPGGYLVVIEWVPEKLPNREVLFPISKEDMLSLLEQQGFSLQRELPLGITHYGFLLKLPEN